MNVGDIFLHDLGREIKEIIKVDDADVADVSGEIDEYVVTEHINDALVELLDAYQESIQKPTEQVNAWISGFFGSGKSSFAKIFGYLLSNASLGGTTAADLFTAKLDTTSIKALLNTIHVQAPTLAVFVDLSSARNVAREGESVVLPLYRQLLADLDYARDVTLAELEISLEETGDLEHFVTAFKAVTGHDWRARRDKALALNEASQVLHTMIPERYSSPDSYARTRPSVEITANGFATRALLLLSRRRPSLKRVVFIVDEVGQYVSRSVHRMLDLQGLAHSFQKEDGRLWLVATGQETLEDVVGALGDKRVELARVRDRFPLTVDLVPNDIEEVVSKRVLLKSIDGQSAVRAIYSSHEQQLRSNVCLDSPTRGSEVTRDEFVRVYPLLPYQIQLLIDAVSALRAHGGAGPMVGGANRTLIRLAHQLVKTKLSAKPVGALATVPMAYDLMDEMIPGAWRGEISQVAKRHGDESVDVHVAKTVALVSGVRALKLDEHNLAVLVHTSVSAETARPAVAKALERLTHEETLRDSDDGYRLQSPQEKDWEKTRRARELKTGDFNRMLRDRHLPSLFRGLQASAAREFPVQVLFDDDRILDGDVTLRLYEGAQDQLERAVRRSREGAHEDDVFLVFERSELTWRFAEEVFRSQTVVQDAENRNLASADAELLHEERKRLDRAVRQLERSLTSDLQTCTLIFRGNESPLEGKDLRPALSKALGGFVREIYTELDDFNAPVRRTDALSILRADDLSGLPDTLGPGRLRVITLDAEGHRIDETGPVAEFVKAVKDRLERFGSEPTGKWLEEHFHAPPFGAEADVVMVLGAAAVRAGLVRVAHGGVTLSSRTDARLEKVFSGVRDFRAAAFRTREELDVKVRSRVAKLLHQDLVGERPGLATEDLAAFIRKHLEPERERLDLVSARLMGIGLAAPESVTRAAQLLKRIRSEEDEELIQSVDGGRADLKDGILAGRALETFTEGERYEALADAQQTLSVNDSSELGENGLQALKDGREILAGRSYVDRYTDLRAAVEVVRVQRDEAWSSAREDLDKVVADVEQQALPLLDQVTDAARDEFLTRMQAAKGQAALDSSFRPAREVLRMRAAQLPALIDDLRAEVGRRLGIEVRRVSARDLFSEPVRSEDDLEALLARVRAAGEEALKDGELFMLV